MNYYTLKIKHDQPVEMPGGLTHEEFVQFMADALKLPHHVEYLRVPVDLWDRATTDAQRGALIDRARMLRSVRF